MTRSVPSRRFRQPARPATLQSRMALQLIGLASVTALLAAILVYFSVHHHLRENTRQHLLEIVTLAGQRIDPQQHAGLRSPADEASSAYQEIREQLQQIKASTSSLAYVYTMRAVDGQVLFVVDAATNDSISHLGDLYHEATPEFIKLAATLQTPAVDREYSTDHWGTWLSAYAPIYTASGQLDGILGVDMSVADIVLQERQLLLQTGLALLILIPLLGVGGWRIGRSLASPVVRLTHSVERIASGDLSHRVSATSRDELGRLAHAFNAMAEHLQDLVLSLEQRSREIARQAGYLEAAADLSRSAAGFLNQDQLASQVVEQILERLHLYYVGLFLIDDTRQWAVLKAGTGPAGKAMLERGHRIRVGQGMVGWCLENGRPRVSLEVGVDAVRLSTTELPLTRSEAALPLRSRGRIIGALTVQSSQPAAFDETFLNALETMADQLAVSLDNANLFSENLTALGEVQKAYGEQTSQAWGDLLRSRPAQAVTCSARGVQLQDARGLGLPAESEDGLAALPLQVRGQVFGEILAQKPGSRPWTVEELRMLAILTEQLGVALDSARLYQETRRRAERERLAAQIAARLRQSNDPQEILQTAAHELRLALNARAANAVIETDRSG